MGTMSVVKINAIAVPEGMGPELEQRFAARARSVEQMPRFEDFQLLRPVEGEDRYFVYTRWDSEESFQTWVETARRSSTATPAPSRPTAGRCRPAPTCSRSRSCNTSPRRPPPERPDRPASPGGATVRLTGPWG